MDKSTKKVLMIGALIAGIFFFLIKKGSNGGNETTPNFQIGDYLQNTNDPTGYIVQVIAMEYQPLDSNFNPPIPAGWNYLLHWIDGGRYTTPLYENAWWLDYDVPSSMIKVNYQP